MSNNNSGGGGDGDGGQKELELKMSGMSLMTSYNNHSGPPGLSGSTVSTSSVDPHPHDSSIDHSSQAGSMKGSTPSSPNPEVIGHHHHLHQQPLPGSSTDIKGLSRPPGLAGGHVASPIVGGGGPGHSKNSSATSPMLTLTPNSSVDGNSDLYSLGGGHGQASPFQGGDNSGAGGPTMPFLRNNDGRRGDESGDYGGGSGGGGLSNFGSFDLVDSDNDGLLGLDALRDRAYSSPGPMARSFESAPSLRSGLPPPPRVDAASEGRRRRGVSRDNSGRSAGSARPPLSGGNAAHSPHSGDYGTNTNSNNSTGGGDLSLGGLVVPFPPGGRSGDPSPTRQTQEASDYRGFGALGRPEFSGNAQEWEPSNRRRSIAGTEPSAYRYGNEQQPEYEPSRRRSIGTECGREFYQQQQHQAYSTHNDSGYGRGDHGQHQLSDQPFAQKFGALPSLSSHMQQQKRIPSPHQQPYNPMLIPQPKHVRSFSQPGPPRTATPPDHLSMEGGSVGRYTSNGMEDNGGQYPPRDPPRYISPPPPTHHVRTHSGDSFRSGNSRRSASMSHGSLSAGSYDGTGMPPQKRNSQPNLTGGFYGQQALPSMHPATQRMVRIISSLFCRSVAVLLFTISC